MSTDEQDMAQTICSAIAYHLDGFSDAEVLGLYERYRSFDVLLTILGYCDKFACSPAQAEEVLHSSIQEHTRRCFGFYDGQISTGGDRNACWVFKNGISWVELIRPVRFTRRKTVPMEDARGERKGTAGGFTND